MCVLSDCVFQQFLPGCCMLCKWNLRDICYFSFGLPVYLSSGLPVYLVFFLDEVKIHNQLGSSETFLSLSSDSACCLRCGETFIHIQNSLSSESKFHYNIFGRWYVLWDLYSILIKCEFYKWLNYCLSVVWYF